MKLYHIIIILLMISGCKKGSDPNNNLNNIPDTPFNISEVSLTVLGNVQDAGSPHIACTKECCKDLFLHPDKNRKVVSLGLIDTKNKQSFLFDATPDLPDQMKLLKKHASFSKKESPDGIFLTHAHIGHYTGLMYFGKEAMNANKVTVFVMPQMKSFLEHNGPWSQLVTHDNISIEELANQKEVKITSDVRITPFTVPHRDEYSETVGYSIVGPNKSALFIPDIDKWVKWEKSIVEEIAKVDYAILDGTFYDAEEVNHRDISEIPHPFIIESLDIFKDLPESEKNKIYFIHFNHTNPVLNPESNQSRKVVNNGFHIARIHDVFRL